MNGWTSTTSQRIYTEMSSIFTGSASTSAWAVHFSYIYKLVIILILGVLIFQLLIGLLAHKK